MSQNADAQYRATKPQPKLVEAGRLGTWFLDLAIIVYLAALAVFVSLAALGIHAEASKHSAAVLLVVATVIPVATFLLFYFVFLVSSLAGVPLISFSRGLAAIQRHSMAIAGTILLVAVVSAILAFGTA